jgi:hypothetical protein
MGLAWEAAGATALTRSVTSLCKPFLDNMPNSFWSATKQTACEIVTNICQLYCADIFRLFLANLPDTVCI